LYQRKWPYYNGLCTPVGKIIQGDSEKEVNIVGCDTIENFEGKKFE
jgi:hypothetical protein